MGLRKRQQARTEGAKPAPRVALLIESSRSYGRALLHGIIRYQHEHSPWEIVFQPQGLGEIEADWLRCWQGDGILVRAETPRVAQAVLRSGLPAVELRFRMLDLRLPAIGVDTQATARLALDHLWERGLRSFGFYGLPPRENYWFDYRGECFERQVHQRGGQCSVFRTRRSRRRPSGLPPDATEIAAWVRSLPQPVGIMAANDDCGQHVLAACLRFGLPVPDQIAVIGVDNDELVCELTTPPLSSVAVGAEQVGYAAAALLADLMAGKPAPAQPIFLPPIGVVARQSTDVLASADADLIEVIRFIRNQACQGIRVEEIYPRTTLSPSTLKRRFKQLLGRSPKEEIVRVQLERARELLTRTDLSVSDVALKCGFSEPRRLHVVFHQQVGMTPRMYRKKVRTGEWQL